MNLTSRQRELLQEEYADRIVDTMSEESLVDYVTNSMSLVDYVTNSILDNLDQLSMEGLTNLVATYDPELLQKYTTENSSK